MGRAKRNPTAAPPVHSGSFGGEEAGTSVVMFATAGLPASARLLGFAALSPTYGTELPRGVSCPWVCSVHRQLRPGSGLVGWVERSETQQLRLLCKAVPWGRGTWLPRRGHRNGCAPREHRIVGLRCAQPNLRNSAQFLGCLLQNLQRTDHQLTPSSERLTRLTRSAAGAPGRGLRCLAPHHQ